MSTVQPPKFHTDTEFAQAVRALFDQLQARLELSTPVTAYVAGGVAIHLYTAYRSSNDIDAEFSHRLLIPDDLVIEVADQSGIPRLVHFDRQYNSTFALMHEDYVQDSLEVPLNVPNFQIRALAPVDLAVSKIARFADHDKRDIEMLVSHGLTTADAIQHRAMQALPSFVGNNRWLQMNIDDAVQLARAAEARNLGYDINTVRQAEPGKTYTGVLLAVSPDRVVQATPDGPIGHSRSALNAQDLLVAGSVVEIRYPHGSAGLVQPAPDLDKNPAAVQRPEHQPKGPEFGG